MIESKLNSYAVASVYLIEQFSQNPLVNTIIFGVPANKDLNRSAIFPIVNISPSNVLVNGQRFEIEYDIAVLDVRKEPNTLQTTKIFGDNLIDSLNTSIAILSKEITKLHIARNPYDIELLSSTAAQPIIFSDKNLLDGWECKIIVSIQNEIDVRG